MSNMPQNPYNNTPGVPPMNINAGAPPLNHQTSLSQVPASQLPPGFGQIKQDANYNSSVPAPAKNMAMGVQNHFNQSGHNSPAFNASGLPPNSSSQSSPLRPQFKPATPVLNQSPSIPLASLSFNANSSSNPNAPGYFQANNNGPVLPTTSQYSQPSLNGPPNPTPPPTANQYPPASNMFTSPVVPPGLHSTGNYQNQLGNSNIVQQSSMAPPIRPTSSTQHSPMNNFPNIPYSGPPRQSPFISQPGSFVNQPPRPMAPLNGAPQTTNRPQHIGMTAPPTRPPMPSNGPVNHYGPPTMPPQIGPPRGLPPGPVSGPPMAQPRLPYNNPQHIPPPVGPQSLPPMGPTDPLKSNMQNRYPPMAQPNYPQQMPPMPQPNMSQQYPQQNTAQAVTQQMGQLSVTKTGFDQLWGHHMLDLMQARHILPEYPEDPPEIKLGPPFTEAPNCAPDIFRCTVNRIPDTNSLLQKSRLPLGILIHPFKDLNYLPVIQCTTIVRCRACRTYINPFVYFVDAKRWKCNLCYRVNDLPEEFQYDPVTKSYGDPTRRPEVKSATIEFIAPGEYMLRPPQPAVYLFLMDVSSIARESGYLQVLCDTLSQQLDSLPGDARTQVGFVCFDAHVHFYLMSDGLTRPKEMTVLDVDDVFLPSPESLLVNLGERKELVKELLSTLPRRYSGAGPAASALGAALQAAYKLMAPTGGRITVFQTCLPNVGPGALSSREDPNARSSKEVSHLNPATDFYKRLALDCSGAQIAVDLFLLNSQYADLATLSGMSKFSGGSVYHLPLYKSSRAWQAARLARLLHRYLTRKIGFEAVMRVRCTRGISIHTFHGNFFVRSTDLLSLPNVSPDAAFGMQLTIEESLADLSQVCFQAALLYTSSKGERRIRVHTLALPIANNLTDVLYSADQQCIVGLLAKMAVDRCQSASMSEAREALVNVAVDALSAHRLAQKLPSGDNTSSLHAPLALAQLPMYLLALTKAKAFRTGLSTRLDDRVFAMCQMKSLPLCDVIRSIYPDLYPVHELREHVVQDGEPDPPRIQLTAERISINGAYLMDDGETMILYICNGVSPAFLSEVFGVTAFSQLQDEARALPKVDSVGNELLRVFIDKLNEDRVEANLLILRDNSPAKFLFVERLVEDRVESAFSYYEFLQHVKNQVK